MAPTRRYMDHVQASQQTSIGAALIALLFLAALVGGLIYVNIEVWTAIFD